jgi:putative ABC transport system permease protein
VPVLAALVPVIGGARITAHQAISAYGLGGRFGRGWLDRLLGRIGSGRPPTALQLSRPAVLSLRNTFRRKARVALTLMTLALGGAMFMMVMSVNGSFRHTIEMLISDFGDDVNVGFARPCRVDRLVEVAESVPGVVSAEIWGGYYGTRLKLASGEERYIGIWGLPPGSEVFNPRIVSGRMLLPDDDHAILLNHTIAVEEGIQVGDQVRFDLYGQETAWTVVGLVLFVYPTQSFVPFDALAQETGSVGRGTRVIVVSEEHDTAYQKRLVQDLRDAYAANGIKATWSWSSGEMRESQWEQFEIILYLLLSMAILAAAVGGIGLMSTASINVVERRREIGVMRATGATSSAIAGIFVGEGVLLGVLSWLFAVPLSYPGARLFSDVVGGQLLNLPLDFVYSVGGMLLWLGIVIGLSALASLWPALQATEVSVREALAYE